MIFVTTFGIGLAAGLMRSAFSIIAASLAILAAFAAASVLSGGASLVALLAAIGGYNFGLIVFFGSQLLDRTPA